MLKTDSVKLSNYAPTSVMNKLGESRIISEQQPHLTSEALREGCIQYAYIGETPQAVTLGLGLRYYGGPNDDTKWVIDIIVKGNTPNRIFFPTLHDARMIWLALLGHMEDLVALDALGIELDVDTLVGVLNRGQEECDTDKRPTSPENS